MTPEQIELSLKKYDDRISETEKTLAWLQEQRREFVNRHDLNKPVRKLFTLTNNQTAKTSEPLLLRDISMKYGLYEHGFNFSSVYDLERGQFIVSNNRSRTLTRVQ